jgi:anti-sigma factor RsiW
MIEHVTDQLGAYLDGELERSRRRQVEEHLQDCPSCRKELAELRTLSSYLQDSLPQAGFQPADLFAANLALQLNARQPLRQPLQPDRGFTKRRGWEFFWWAVPFAVLGVFAFVQVYFAVSAVFTSADQAGLLGGSLTWLQTSPQETLWYSASLSLFGSQIHGTSQAVLNLMNDFSIFGSNFFIHLLWQAGFALVYWAWLGFWWKSRRFQAVQRQFSRL